jgi:hypothetical protein
MYCTLNADGSVGTCTEKTNAFTTVRYEHSSVVYKGYLYIIGGNSPTSQNSIQFCPLNTNGSVGTCDYTHAGIDDGTSFVSGAFTTPRSQHTSVVYNGYLYVIGGSAAANATGCDASGFCNDIQYCPLNSNGTVGTCTQQLSAFTTPRSEHTSVVYNGYLYIIGGLAASSYFPNDIQYCPLNSNGSVGTCVKQTGAFARATSSGSAVAYNGYLYISGGTTILICPLNVNGSVGTCAEQTSAYTTSRVQHTSVAYNGYLYIIGGTNAGTYLSDIQYLKLTGPQWKSHYERLLDIGYVTTSLTSIVYNGSTPCDAQFVYRTAGSNGLLGSTTTVINALPGITYSINQPIQRYVWVDIAMDDSSCGGTSYVTDITLNFTANPAAPTLSVPTASFIGAQILPNFQMRSSDPNSDYLKYKIDVCSNSDCSSIIRTIDQTSSQTGWTGQDAQTGTAYVGSSTVTSSTMANHTYQAPALSLSTQYWWRAYAIDPAGDNTWSAASAIQSFTTQSIPSAPTLVAPASSATGISSMTIFQMRSSDADSDYLRYKIDVCTTSNCSSILRTIDQTSSQTGWAGQDANNATAYSSNSSVNASRIAQYTAQTVLSPNTQYWWRAYAIDPTGTNTWSAASSISTFTTTQNETFLKGGITTPGGIHFGN